MLKNISKTSNALRYELQQEGAYLWPMRLFIGLGWGRAALEKAIDSSWVSGETLTSFFFKQLESGEVIFPFYKVLIEQVFLPMNISLAWLIMFIQFFLASSLLFGIKLRWGLALGIFLNLNFILIGKVNPSVFYIIIQLPLLLSQTAPVMSVASHLQNYSNKLPAVGSFENKNCTKATKRNFSLTLAGLALFMALLLPYIKDYGPASVTDPAMVLLILTVLTGIFSAISFVQTCPQEKVGRV